jgi:hypothetical protein
MADGGPTRQPGKLGKRELCIEEGGSREKQENIRRKPLKQIQLMLIPVYRAYSVQRFPCGKWSKLNVIW